MGAVGGGKQEGNVWICKEMSVKRLFFVVFLPLPLLKARIYFVDVVLALDMYYKYLILWYPELLSLFLLSFHFCLFLVGLLSTLK